MLAGLAALAWLGAPAGPRGARRRRGGGADQERGGAEAAGRSGGAPPWTVRAREIAAALRDWGTLRWLLLIEVADLLVDVFTGFLALYLVDVAHLSPSVAALAIAIRLGAALAGDAALVVILDRAGDLAVLRASAVAAALLYPGFLLVPGTAPKLVVLAALSAATAPWYPILQARLYGSLPGRSSVAVTLSSAAGLAGGLGPLAVGLVAQGFGLSWALAGLVVVPVAVLLVAAGARARRGGRSRRRTPTRRIGACADAQLSELRGQARRPSDFHRGRLRRVPAAGWRPRRPGSSGRGGALLSALAVRPRAAAEGLKHPRRRDLPLPLPSTGGRVGLLGRFGIGAPAATAVLEELAALGTSAMVSVGTAGSLQHDLQPGDLVLCEAAVRD